VALGVSTATDFLDPITPQFLATQRAKPCRIVLEVLGEQINGSEWSRPHARAGETGAVFLSVHLGRVASWASHT
jgi:hypothetical protein